MGLVLEVGLKVWVVSQLELCWNMAFDDGEALLELNGRLEVGAWVECGTGCVEDVAKWTCSIPECYW